MIIVIGCVIVIVSVFGGFVMGGGNLGALVHFNELLIIGGGALGALIVMSPRKVLMDITKGLLVCLKGTPHSRTAYEELLKVLYELFLLGRRNGMIALEEHVMEPQSSTIFKRYPVFFGNKAAMEFLCGSLRPIIDGKIKPDQLRLLLDVELDRLEQEHHAPVNVLNKTADAMPGFGIVAAVLGIVITMASISGPIEEIGHHVAAALVGTFLGILVAYGFVGPISAAMEQRAVEDCKAFELVKMAFVASVRGYAPPVAIEFARKLLFAGVRPSFTDLEAHLKGGR